MQRGVKGTIEIIRRNIELEARLIDDILDLTAIAKGKITSPIIGTVEAQLNLVDRGWREFLKSRHAHRSGVNTRSTVPISRSDFPWR